MSDLKAKYEAAAEETDAFASWILAAAAREYIKELEEENSAFAKANKWQAGRIGELLGLFTTSHGHECSLDNENRELRARLEKVEDQNEKMRMTLPVNSDTREFVARLQAECNQLRAQHLKLLEVLGSPITVYPQPPVKGQ